MKQCTSCGLALPDDAHFCGRCGSAQADAEEQRRRPLMQGLPALGALGSQGQTPIGNVPMVQGTPQVGGVPMVQGNLSLQSAQGVSHGTMGSVQGVTHAASPLTSTPSISAAPG